MSGWWRNRLIGRTPAGPLPPPGPGASGTMRDRISSGTTLLERSRVETPELGPLAKLPPFSPVIIRVLQLFGNEEVDLADVSKLVETDPALTGEILGVVNSPLYPISRSVTSASHGVALLGADQIKELATTLALRSMMRGSPKSGLVGRLWRHSVGSAVIARQLAPLFGVDKGLGYTAAIIHDLGRLGLLAAHGEAYARLTAAEHESAVAALAAERDLFGMDHCSAGLLLSRSWGLPVMFQDAIAHHHRSGCSAAVLGLVHAACRIADASAFESTWYRERRSASATAETCVQATAREQVTRTLGSLKLAAEEALQSFGF